MALRHRLSAVEDAILDRVAEGPASHTVLVKTALAAGVTDSEARATIRRLQSSGLIGHNLTIGYVLGCLLPNT